MLTEQIDLANERVRDLGAILGRHQEQLNALGERDQDVLRSTEERGRPPGARRRASRGWSGPSRTSRACSPPWPIVWRSSTPVERVERRSEVIAEQQSAVEEVDSRLGELSTLYEETRGQLDALREGREEVGERGLPAGRVPERTGGGGSPHPGGQPPARRGREDPPAGARDPAARQRPRDPRGGARAPDRVRRGGRRAAQPAGRAEPVDRRPVGRPARSPGRARVDEDGPGQPQDGARRPEAARLLAPELPPAPGDGGPDGRPGGSSRPVGDDAPADRGAGADPDEQRDPGSPPCRRRPRASTPGSSASRACSTASSARATTPGSSATRGRATAARSRSARRSSRSAPSA